MTNSTFAPLSWQEAPWRDKSPTLLLTGAAGGGKSRIAAEKTHAYLLRYPGATGIVGRKSRASANKSVVPFLRYTVQGDTGWGEYKKGDQLFEYNNGSQLWVVGLRDERQREALRSIGKDGSVDIAWFEEANKLTEDDNNEIAARMRGTAADWRQIIYTTNPDGPNHWIKKQLIDGNRATVYYSRPEDNPYNPPEYIERLKNLTGVAYQRLWMGQWMRTEGAVYTEYEAARHLIDWDDLPGLDNGLIPRSGRYVVSIDFGYINAFSASLWYIYNEVAYHAKQIYYSRRTVEEHVPTIEKMTCGLPIEAWITDHDAENRATLERYMGIKTTAAYKSVKPGIENVKSLLSKDRIKFVRGAVVELDTKLEAARKPTSTIDEIGDYAWSDKKEDAPKKTDDHGVDDMRYFAAYWQKLGHKTFSMTPTATIDNYARSER